MEMVIGSIIIALWGTWDQEGLRRDRGRKRGDKYIKVREIAVNKISVFVSQWEAGTETESKP